MSEFCQKFEDTTSDESFDDAGISLHDIKRPPSTLLSGKKATLHANAVIRDSNRLEEDEKVLVDRWHMSTRLTSEQRQELLSILKKYPIWDGVGKLNTGDHLAMPLKHEFKDTSAVQKPYDMSPLKRKYYDELIRELEKQGVVEDSQASRYVSPAFIVIQKGRPRLIIDFRRINSMIQQDFYPLPRQSEIFSALKGSIYISTLDFKKMFYQLPIEEQYRDLTTFITKHDGAKRLTRSMMGFLNSPAHCQRIIDRIIKPYRWESIIVYIDDVVIFSKTWEEHLARIDWFLNELQKVNLTLDPTKCFFGFNSVNLLGHVVSRFGLCTQSSKLDAMKKLQTPRTRKQLMHILGFFGYYRTFIRGFAQISAPLTDLLTIEKTANGTKHEQMSKPIQWGEAQQRAFDLLKEKLADSVVLAHPDEPGFVEYRIYVDGCKLGIGAALHIVHKAVEEASHHDVERPVAFISRSLRKAEKNYWPTELEMLALTWALKKFEELIEGQPLTIFTDHSALKWLFQATNSKVGHNQRLFLWALQLEKWKENAKIVHRPGRAHLNADVLSRFPVDSDTPVDLRRTLSEESDAPPSKSLGIATVSSLSISSDFTKALIQGYKEDKHWRSLYKKLGKDSTATSASVEYHNFRFDSSTKLLSYVDPADKSIRLCIPSSCVERVFRHCHDDVGHLGFNKIYSKVRQQYHIHKLAKILKEYIGACPTCTTLRNKDHRTDLLNPLEIPDNPCETITLDFVTGLPPDGECDGFISVTDKFSKYVTIIPNRGGDKASDVADLFFDHYYPRFGLPLRMISDRDPKFVSKFWKTLFKRLRVDILMSAAYAPQTDGQSERSNQTIENMLRSYIGYETGRNWTRDLKEIEFAINSHPSESTGIPPFMCLYGFVPRSGWITSNNEHSDEDLEVNLDLYNRRQRVRQEALDHLNYARATMARKYDEGRHDRDLLVDDMVYIENRSGLTIPGLVSTKTGPKRFGPFRIKEIVGHAARLDLPSTYRIHDVISKRHLTLAKEDPWSRIPSRPPALVAEDGQEEFEVEAVLDERLFRKRKQYLIKWLGYPIHESDWVDAEQSPTFPEALAKYESLKKKGSRRGRRQAS